MLVVRKHRLPAAIGAMLAAQLMIVWFVIVYSGEHYVIDIVFGVAFSLAAWRLVQRFAGSGATPQPDADDPRRDVPVEREPLTAALR
jgi:hypothetical protein